MGQIDYVNWDGLYHYDAKLKDYLTERDTTFLKFAGEISKKHLPAPLPEYVNAVYKVIEEIDTTEYHSDWFFDQGIYPANTLFQMVTRNEETKYAIFSKSDNDKILEEINSLNLAIESLSETDENLQTTVNNLHTTVRMKQDILISGSNIATINGQSLLTDADIKIDPNQELTFTDKPVAVTLGGFTPGMTLNDKTIGEILEILLCRTFSPSIPQLISSGLLGIVPSIYVSGGNNPRYTSTLESAIQNASTITPDRNCVYEVIENDIITKTGYQISIAGYGRHQYATILVPQVFSIHKCYIFDKISNNWLDYNGTFSATGEIVNIGGVQYVEYIDSISNNPTAINYYRFELRQVANE